MIGLPASGKSTQAESIMKASKNTVRINKDLLRTMLHFDKFTRKNEEATYRASKMLAELYLKLGKDVIIDDTNLNPSTQHGWRKLGLENGADVIDVVIPATVEECIQRDKHRDKTVGKSVIVNTALRWTSHTITDDVIICDIDGTLANCEHRRHFVREGKDWVSFFVEMDKDTPIEEVVNALKTHVGDGCKLIFVSARPENYRAVTEAWISKHYGDEYETLIMRPTDDTRPDTMVKSDIYENYLQRLHIKYVFDDRPSVIRMWESKGLTVIDCSNGEEF